jgi:hypothetical protein
VSADITGTSGGIKWRGPQVFVSSPLRELSVYQLHALSILHSAQYPWGRRHFLVLDDNSWNAPDFLCNLLLAIFVNAFIRLKHNYVYLLKEKSPNKQSICNHKINLKIESVRLFFKKHSSDGDRSQSIQINRKYDKH